MPKHEGKWNVGIEYQLNTIAYAAACLSENDDVEDFEIYTNQNDVPGFDDIIIKVRYKSEVKPFLYLGQIKHFRNKINFKGKKHSLNDYVRFIVQIANEKEQNCFLKELFRDVPDENIEYWYYSNSFFLGPLCQPIVLDDDIVCYVEPSTTNKQIFPVTKTTVCYKLNPKDTDQYSHVFNEFRFLLNQPDTHKTSQCIVDLNIDIFSIEIARKIIYYVYEYLKIATNRKLTKHVFETELLKLCLSPFIVLSTTAFRIDPELANIWNRLVTENNITIIDNISMELKPYIFGCVWQKIKELNVCTFDWNEYILNSEKKQLKIDKNKFTKLTKAEKFRYWLFIPDTIDDLLVEMWKCDYLPLVLNSDTRVSLLNKYKHLCKNIIILDNKGKIYRDISHLDLPLLANGTDIKNFEWGIELLKKIIISLQGREPVDMFSILNDDVDLLKELKCNHLLYLTREKRCFLKEEALSESNSMVFIITDNTNAINQAAIDDIKLRNNENLKIKCKSSDVDFCITKIKENPKLIDYSVCNLQISEGKLEFVRGEISYFKQLVVDDDGNDLYVEKDKIVPIIGKGFRKNENYFNRHLRKPTIETKFFDLQKNVICLLTGNLNSSDFLSIICNEIIEGPIVDVFSKIEAKLAKKKNAFVKIEAEDLEKALQKFSSCKHSLLHVNVENGIMMLLKYQNCKNLTSYISFKAPKFDEKFFFEETSTGTTVIIGEPGAGKTTLLRSLFNRCDKHNFALFCDLSDYRLDLWKRNSELFKNPINFILKKEAKQSTLSNNQYSMYHNYLDFLYAILVKSRELIVFLDSFDEVLPVCEGEVLDFIRVLNQNDIRLIIASRAVVVDTLISSLQVNPIKIETINRDNIKEYTKKEKVTDIELHKYSAEFKENPMYLNFLITLYRENALPASITLSNLYNTIIEKHIERYYIKKGDFYAPTQYKDMRKDILEIHTSLALLEVFGNTIIRISGLDYSKLREECVNTGKVKLGLIVRFNEDGPVFLHRTFAEFLVVEWMIENIDKEYVKDIYEKLFTERMVHIIRLLNDILCGNLALHKAVLAKDLTEVTRLCSKSDTYLKQVDRLNRTALHLAAYTITFFEIEHSLILDTIIQHMKMKGINFSYCDSIKKWTWIQYLHSKDYILGEYYSQVSVIREMYFVCENKLEEGILWSKTHRDYNTAMALLKRINCVSQKYFYDFCLDFITNDRLDLLCELIELQCPNNTKLDILCKACKNVLPVTQVSACINLKIREGFTAMHIACIYGNADVVKELLNLGAEVDDVDHFRLAPLYYAIIQGSVEVVTCLVQHMAVQSQGQKSLIYKLLKVKLSRSSEGWVIFQSYLHLSVGKYRPEITKILLKNGFDIDQRNKRGETCLHIVVQNIIRFNTHYVSYDVIEKIKLLLECKPNCNIQDNNGNTPLHTAVKNCRREIVELLLQHGANANITDKQLFTPLHNAFGRDTEPVHGYSSRRDDFTKTLLVNGADVNRQNNFGNTVLHLAANPGYCSHLMKIYLDHGGDVSIENEDGDTALLIAVKGWDDQTITMLLENGADVNHRNKIGYTPLHIAAKFRNTKAMKILLDNGADVDVVNKNGLTAFCIANEEKFIEIKELLLKHMKPK